MAELNGKKGRWITVKGRHIFIKEGESVAKAINNTFGAKSRESRLSKARTERGDEFNAIREKAKGERDEAKYEKAKNSYWSTRDRMFAQIGKNRETKIIGTKINEPAYIKLAEENTNRAYKDAEDFKAYRGQGIYKYHDDKWADKYYEFYRESERKNAKLKEQYAQPTDKYFPVEAYAGYAPKRDYLDENRKGTGYRWTGKEYTNDEFLEHLEDANWHTERKMLIDAGLTNQQLEYIKNNTRLDIYTADLDREKTERLIKEAKAKFPEKNGISGKYKLKYEADKRRQISGIGTQKYKENKLLDKYSKKWFNEGNKGNIEGARQSFAEYQEQMKNPLTYKMKGWKKSLDAQERLGNTIKDSYKEIYKDEPELNPLIKSKVVKPKKDISGRTTLQNIASRKAKQYGDEYAKLENDMMLETRQYWKEGRKIKSNEAYGKRTRLSSASKMFYYLKDNMNEEERQRALKSFENPVGEFHETGYKRNREFYKNTNDDVQRKLKSLVLSRKFKKKK